MLTPLALLHAAANALPTFALLATFSSCVLLVFMYGMRLLDDEDDW